MNEYFAARPAAQLKNQFVPEPQHPVFVGQNPLLYLGASPRASIAMLIAAKAFAGLRGRDFVTPEDIKDAAIPVLIHRVIVSPEREMEGFTAKQIIHQIIESIEIPR